MVRQPQINLDVISTFLKILAICSCQNMFLFLILITFASAKIINETVFDALITIDNIHIKGKCIS